MSPRVPPQLGRVVCATLVAAGVAGSCGDDSPVGGSGQGGAQGGGAQGAGAAGAQGPSTASTGSGELPRTFLVEGVVVDQDDRPVAGALVLQGGGEVQVTTGSDGAFAITLTQELPGIPTAVAAKVGYRSTGQEIEAIPSEPIVLMIRVVEPPDNALGYSFGHPGVGDPMLDSSTLFCGHCHTTFAAQFQTSAHARSARDPEVQDLYAGVASSFTTQAACNQAGGTWRSGTLPGSPGVATSRCYVGAGVLPDLNTCGSGLACDDPALPSGGQPTAFGACADCHALGMDGPSGGRNLLEASGIGFEHGNHCDACHHVRDVDLAAPPGAGGRLIMQRPREKQGDQIGAPILQAMFGPYPDVPNAFMGGSYQPKFSTAEICAGCHEQLQDALLPGSSLDPARFPNGLPTHSTFSEWQDGPFGNPGTPCQFCHMPPIDSMVNSVDVTTENDIGVVFGFRREPEQIREHTFRGPLWSQPGIDRLLDTALIATVNNTQLGNELEVDVELDNVGCGHALPTGEPMRAAFLLVSASGCGGELTPVAGPTLPDVLGRGQVGELGQSASLAGSVLSWPSVSAAPGDVVRIVRPSGTFWDYDGVGLFEGSLLSPTEKGLPVLVPVGSATVTSASAGTLNLDLAITAQAGDLVYLGDALPDGLAVADGDGARALAGAPGVIFARVLTDPSGARNVPHHRAIDIASDSRIRPGGSATSSHRFAIPSGCLEADVHVRVLYRPLPLSWSLERGWDARDYVALARDVTVTLSP